MDVFPLALTPFYHNAEIPWFGFIHVWQSDQVFKYGLAAYKV